jgi:hypothetical protein
MTLSGFGQRETGSHSSDNASYPSWWTTSVGALHTNNGMLSPVDFETRQLKLNEADVWETRETSENYAATRVTSGWKSTS